ncbi:MAG: hypothetical protein IJW22_02530 [Clostridia bacterium]|nr:hypothetical protein [Clostridia bacterium]
MLDSLLAQKAISPETYVNIYPEDAISDQTRVLEAIRTEREGELAQLRIQVEQLTASLEQAEAEDAQKQKAFDAVQGTIKENQALKEQLGELYAQFVALQQEATKRINLANEVIRNLEADGMEVARDAQEMAMALAAQQGMAPV